MKRLLLSIAVLLALLCGVAAAESVTLVASGNCGSDGSSLTWSLDSAGTLTISGTGEMQDYLDSNTGRAPWYDDYHDSITKVVIRDGVTHIGDSAFLKCRYLTEISISGSVASIGADAFESCIRLTDIVLPEGVESIGYGAFTFCEALKSVRIPNSLSSLGGNVFFECRELTDVYATDLEHWMRLPFQSPESNPMYYADNLYFGDQLVENLQIPEGVSSIGANTFYGCSGLKSVSFPDSLTTIGESAFRSCTGLTGLSFPDSLTTIGDSAFRDCTGLTDLSLPDRATALGRSVFSGCAGLTSISLPEDLTQISYGLFSGCSGISSFTIPPKVTRIEGYAFSNCTGLRSIAIPESVTQIDDWAFQYCRMLSSISIPNTVSEISEYALYRCSVDLVVSCHRDSAAHALALQENYDVDLEEHDDIQTGNMDPDCVEAGYIDTVCSICGYSHRQVLDALGHNYEETDRTEPECETPGSITYTCSRCGDTYDEELEELAHDYQLTERVEYCEMQGWEEYVCSHCGDSYTLPVSAQGHNYENGVCTRCNLPIPTPTPTPMPTPTPPPAPSLPNSFRQKVLDTDMSVCLPNGSYRRSDSTSTTEYWVAPQLILMFKRMPNQYPVRDWAVAMESMYDATYTSINGIPVAFGTKYSSEDGGYKGACIFNYGSYSYNIISMQMTAAQASSFRAICETLYQGSIPEAKPIRHMILSSGLFIDLPGDAYLYNESNGTEYWSSPSKNLLIGFSEMPYASLAEWYGLLEQEGQAVYIANINGVEIIFFYEYDAVDDLYDMSCFVNDLNHTYLIVSAGMTEGERLEFESVLNTLKSTSLSAKRLELPDSLLCIEEEAFANCDAEVVVIPSGCETIGALAFCNSASIQYIDIPASVTSIAQDAFSGCGALTIIAPSGSAALSYAKAHGISSIPR